MARAGTRPEKAFERQRGSNPLEYLAIWRKGNLAAFGGMLDCGGALIWKLEMEMGVHCDHYMFSDETVFLELICVFLGGNASGNV